MVIFRRKISVVFLFVLISMGQSFSLCYTFNFSKQNVVSALDSAKPLPAHLIVCGHDFNETLRENPQPHQKSHEEILSLRSDPFIPVIYLARFPVMETMCLSSEKILIQAWKASPPDKPPRYFS